MIQQESRLKVADNSGARELLCIRVKGGSHRRYASGRRRDHRDRQIRRARRAASARARSCRPSSCGPSKPLGRPDGTYISFDENAAVLIDPANNNPRGTRISAPSPANCVLEKLHEDHLARAGGPLTWPRNFTSKRGDQVVVISGKDARQDRPGRCAPSRRSAASTSRA